MLQLSKTPCHSQSYTYSVSIVCKLLHSSYGLYLYHVSMSQSAMFLYYLIFFVFFFVYCHNDRFLFIGGPGTLRTTVNSTVNRLTNDESHLVRKVAFHR